MRDIILLVSLVAVSLALEDCGLSPLSRGYGYYTYRSSDQVGKRQKIYGPLRQEAGPGEFPWMVQIIRSGPDNTYCGGTLIAKNWVLTAAHCVLEDNPRKIVHDPIDLIVRVGAWRQDTPDGTDHTEEIRVEKIIPHTEYDGKTEKNDIALIKLKWDADCSSEYVGTACLPNPGDDYQGSEDCWVTGWGTWFEPDLIPNKLQKVKGRIQWDTFLKSNWGIGEIYPGMIGFKTRPVNVDSNPQWSIPVKGDSGGPLVCVAKSKLMFGSLLKYDVVGIVSWGPIIGVPQEEHKSTVFSSVTYFLDWIKNNMNRYG